MGKKMDSWKLEIIEIIRFADKLAVVLWAKALVVHLPRRGEFRRVICVWCI